VGATNIRLRWSREEIGRCGCYKHSAPLEPGGDGGLRVLQTFGSAGAGRRWRAAGATNIRLRWSRERNGGLRVLQTLGALEPGKEWRVGGAANTRALEPPTSCRGSDRAVKEADSICNLTGGLWWCENHRDAKKPGENAANDSCAVSAP